MVFIAITKYLVAPINSLTSVINDYRNNPSTFLLYSFVVKEAYRLKSIPFCWNNELNRIEYVKEKWKLYLWKLTVLTQWTVSIVHMIKFRYTFFEIDSYKEKVLDAMFTLVHLSICFYSVNSIVVGKDLVHFLNSVTQFDTKWREITSTKALQSWSKLADCFLIMLLLSGYVISPLNQIFYWSDPCRTIYIFNSFLFGSSCRTMNKAAFVPGALFEWITGTGSLSLFTFYIATLFITAQRPLYRLSQISTPHIMKGLLKKDSNSIPKLYRMITILYKMQEYCFRYIMNPVTSMFMYGMFVLTLFCTLSLYESLSIGAYLIFPVMFLGIATILYSIIQSFGSIHHVSLIFLHSWKSQLNSNQIWQRKFLKSCWPLRVMKGNQQIKKASVLDYYNAGLNDTNSLLIST